VGGYDAVSSTPTYGIAIYNGTSFEGISTQNTQDFKRLDDIIVYRDEIYIVGQSMAGPPEYEWDGFAKIENGDLIDVHPDFTGNHFQTWVYGLEVFQDELYIGGKFYRDDGYTGNGIQRFNGAEMFEVGGGVNFDVMDMMVYKGELYVVGNFNRIGEGTEWLDPGSGTLCNGVAKWNGQEWECLLTEERDGRITTLDIHDDILYIGGEFRHIGGDSAMSMVAKRRIFPNPIIDYEEEISIYPNPSNGQLTLEFGSYRDKISINIFNALGQNIWSETIEDIDEKQDLDLNNFSSGLYILQIESGGIFTERKVVFEN